jgi:hypothetical protein
MGLGAIHHHKMIAHDRNKDVFITNYCSDFACTNWLFKRKRNSGVIKKALRKYCKALYNIVVKMLVKLHKVQPANSTSDESGT